MRARILVTASVLAVVAVVVGVGGSGAQPGVDDGPVAADAGPEYVLHPDPIAGWPDPDLTYGFVNATPDVSVTAQRKAIRRAFNQWASVTTLTFTRVDDCGLPQNDPACTTPDIRIGFYGRDHGPDEWDPQFDGRGASVAHAFYPLATTGSLAGDIHFDESERWTTNGNGVDLQAVALHEIGHALGIKHSDDARCATAGNSMLRPTMCQSFSRTDRILAPDDVAAVRAFYGTAGVTCGGFPVTVNRARGQRPNARDNVILGRPGNETLNGLGGRDVICGVNGNDTINGGPGGDTLIGGNGRDVCDGGSGSDRAQTCEVRRNIP